MKYQEFTHALRSVTKALDIYEVIVIGSQSILGIHPTPPESLLVSNEVDFVPLMSKEQLERHDYQYYLDYINGLFGNNSQFYKTYGYYVDGCEKDTSTAPLNWETRLIKLQGEDTNLRIAYCIEPHDLAVAKLAAYREKDLRYVKDLIKFKMIDPNLLKKRLFNTPKMRQEQQKALVAWVDGQQKQLYSKIKISL